MHTQHSEFDLKYATYFLNWFNKTYNFDYKAFENDEQKSPVDIYGKSSLGRLTLNLQMSLAEGGVIKLAHENTKQFKKGLKHNIVAANIDFDNWITETIKFKEGRYSKSVKNSLILIVQGYSPTPDPVEVRKFYKNYENSDFKGIYYVSLPVVSYPPKNPSGYVEPIKDLIF